ncbi:hypothetical protein BCR36DRAFT_98207 [Piromyces finnis]|uniref:Uncharacterized protein n=1 Tax=Piromyces finnis TaxID=1754191 RepID=A0A1Y1V4K5_9FUNG|nr:hypothetical protein BCR36DRAFT_98207 [Piromyces finnis]|eukprot:ORX47132.1 hypothetical protein BCR36DRAFT_98207 [Piromyces finnis]
MEKSEIINKKSIVFNTIIMMLTIWFQAIAKLFIFPNNIEFMIFRFISLYLIVVISVYLYSICKVSSNTL